MLRSDRGGGRFGGHPIHNGWPKNETDEFATGFITHPQQQIRADLHWRHDGTHVGTSDENYNDLHPVGNLNNGTNFDGQSIDLDADTKHKVTYTTYPGRYISNSRSEDDNQHLVNDKEDHFIRDYNDPSSISTELYKAAKSDKNATARRTHYQTHMDFGDLPVFSGSTTHVNPYDDDEKRLIIEQGLEHHEKLYVNEKGYTSTNHEAKVAKLPPISPLHPFTRMEEPKYAREAVLTTYDRSHIPIADVEFRKSFRHTFINRPECYVMYKNGGATGLCEQAKFDEDFSSLYTRMPHLIELLAPTYVTGTFGRSNLNDNWNYLLSNRIISVTTPSEQLSLKESTTKSVEGITVSPGLHFDSRAGSTISISFRDTKYFEVYEFIKAWMLYIHKRERGQFLPSYNGYQYENAFATGDAVQLQGVSDAKVHGLHPYDRCLEYCTSIFDFITDEADTNIRTWYKYYGVFPVSVSTSIASENSGAITNEMRVDVTFRYQYKLEGVNKTLVEFNYNSGIVDHLGRQTDTSNQAIMSSMPFWCKDVNTYLPAKDGLKPEHLHWRTMPSEADAMREYIGAAGLFTGTPFILMTRGMPHPLSASGSKPMSSVDMQNMVIPTLRFCAIKDRDFLDSRINLGFEVEASNYGVMEYAQTSSNVVSNSSDAPPTELVTTGDSLHLKDLGNEIIDRVKEFGKEFVDETTYAYDFYLNNSIVAEANKIMDAAEIVVGTQTLAGGYINLVQNVANETFNTAVAAPAVVAGAIAGVVNGVTEIIDEIKN